MSLDKLSFARVMLVWADASNESKGSFKSSLEILGSRSRSWILECAGKRWLIRGFVKKPNTCVNSHSGLMLLLDYAVAKWNMLIRNNLTTKIRCTKISELKSINWTYYCTEKHHNNCGWHHSCIHWLPCNSRMSELHQQTERRRKWSQEQKYYKSGRPLKTMEIPVCMPKQ